MQIARTIKEARELRSTTPGKVALVPTMGTLHEGHLRHVHRCREIADHVLLSIFVNPTQFGPGEDYHRYPRQLDQDLEQCRAAGVRGVFVPSEEQIYPPHSVNSAVDVPVLTGDLEGTFRPGHFLGVCRIVLKLLSIIQPHFVTFGLKDYQQLRVIDAMVCDLAIPVRIIEVQTVREVDGLAISSRNRFIAPAQRKRALGLYKSLKQAKMMIEQEGEVDPHVVERAMAQVLIAHQLEVDYAVVRHPVTLGRLNQLDPALTGGVVVLVAVRLGDIRLIDNFQLLATAQSAGDSSGTVC